SNEYVTYGVNPAESRERFEEALQLIVRAWTEPQPFGWQGRYYEYRAISIWPRPVQQPHPPIYMSGSSPESGEFAARLRIKLDVDQRIEQGQLLAGSPERVLTQIQAVRDALGAGILDLMWAPVGRDKILKGIELFGTQVLPRMHEL